MQFNKILGSFVFHVLIENEVYRISCPKEGHSSANSRLVVFPIDFSLGDASQKIEVSVTSTLMVEAGELPEETLPLAILRAAKIARIDKSFKISIDTESYKEFLEDDYKDLPDDIFEDELILYINERYSILSGKRFSVLETAVAFNVTIERIVNTLRLLHKNEMVSFGWARDSWVEKDSKAEWLVEEFGVGTKHSRDNDENNNNYESLALLPDNNRLQDETWDFFICHASEDKKDVVEPLAIKLTDLGCRVWYDHWTLNIGDSLSRKIDEGLAKSKFGVVVLSAHFFQREWPQRELSGLVQKEIRGEKVILPVWHNVTPDFIRSQSPTLADKLAGSTSEGIEALAQEILMASGLEKGDKQNTYTKGSAVGPAQLIVSYENVHISSDLHVYGLSIVLQLLVPPDQGRLRLKISWPTIIPVTKSSNMSEEKPFFIDGIEFRRFVLDWDGRVFPGETVQLIGSQSNNEFEYRFDDAVWSAVEKNPLAMDYALHFEDHGPLKGSILVNDLNNF